MLGKEVLQRERKVRNLMNRQEAYDILMNYANGIGTMAVEYWSEQKDGQKMIECINVLMYQKEESEED